MQIMRMALNLMLDLATKLLREAYWDLGKIKFGAITAGDAAVSRNIL